jgi:hypothetical protein
MAVVSCGHSLHLSNSAQAADSEIGCICSKADISHLYTLMQVRCYRVEQPGDINNPQPKHPLPENPDETCFCPHPVRLLTPQMQISQISEKMREKWP